MKLAAIAFSYVDDVVGYAHAEVRNAAATIYKKPQSALHVVAMVVAASHSGRGVGQALLGALQDEAASRGVRELSLEVYAFNTAARAFYEKAGFMPLREYLTLRVTGRSDSHVA